MVQQHNIGSKEKKDFSEDISKERLNQITSLTEWAKNNTDYINISPLEAVKFFDSDKENLNNELEHVFKIYSSMKSWAQSQFNIGKYTAMEYANQIILKRTEGHDLEKIREGLQMDKTLINPVMSISAKISFIQNTVLEIQKEIFENEIPQTELLSKLVQSGKFIEKDALQFIEKAIKLGTIAKTKPGYITI